MKVQITLNDKLVEKIDKYAAAIGMTRSSICAYWIGQAVLGFDKASQTLDRMGTDVLTLLTQEHDQSGEK